MSRRLLSLKCCIASLQYLPKSHGYRYEMSNCLFEAALEKILEVNMSKRKEKYLEKKNILLQTCRCFPGLTTATGLESTCTGKDDLVCVNNLMNMMGDFDTVVYKVCDNHEYRNQSQ